MRGYRTDRSRLDGGRHPERLRDGTLASARAQNPGQRINDDPPLSTVDFLDGVKSAYHLSSLRQPTVSGGVDLFLAFDDAKFSKGSHHYISVILWKGCSHRSDLASDHACIQESAAQTQTELAK